MIELTLPKQQYTGTHIYLCSYTRKNTDVVLNGYFITTTTALRYALDTRQIPGGDRDRYESNKENTSHHKGQLITLGTIADSLKTVLQRGKQKRYAPEISIYFPARNDNADKYLNEITRLVPQPVLTLS